MTTIFLDELQRNGPEQCEALDEAEARAWCVRTARSHYENFSVLSRLVPPDLRADFAAVYAFCRWADDLSDEVRDADRSLELLQWWREELRACFAGEPRHPVFRALAPTVRRRDLPITPFDDLIRAFEQDQRVTRYETWDELLEYCRGSADPVGRLVLMMCGEPRTPEIFARSDDICTALQLTNHWQDVRRDILERDRIYIPREMHSIDDFERRLRESASQGWAIDHSFLEESRRAIRSCAERTWPLFERGEALLDFLSPTSRPIVWLFLAGGVSVLHRVEMWNYETALHRPKLGATAKAALVFRAWLKTKVGGWARSGSEAGP